MPDMCFRILLCWSVLYSSGVNAWSPGRLGVLPLLCGHKTLLILLPRCGPAEVAEACTVPRSRRMQDAFHATKAATRSP